MSLVDSSHLASTTVRRDCHYKVRNGKPAMILWFRGGSPEDRSCVKCLRTAWEHEIICPRCKTLLSKKK